MRQVELTRKTGETDISLSLNLDGSGKTKIDSGVGLLDHMLTLFASHGGFDLTLSCKGDTRVDDHHSVEDIGIVLGAAFRKACDPHGITRYGDIILPMDEALVLAAVDLSGRGVLGYEVQIPTEKVGTFDTELAEEFWLAFVRNAGITLHIRLLAGKNSHHILEGCFKAVAHCLRKATSPDPLYADRIPSTKGVL